MAEPTITVQIDKITLEESRTGYNATPATTRVLTLDVPPDRLHALIQAVTAAVAVGTTPGMVTITTGAKESQP